MSKLAEKVIEEHKGVFDSFDLTTNHNYVNLDEEARSIALFNAEITLSNMEDMTDDPFKVGEIVDAIKYIQSQEGYFTKEKDE